MKVVEYDVFGRRLVAESDGQGWKAWFVGDDGKRRPANIVIPSDLDATAIGTYLDDLFHEQATPEHPAVRIL